MTVTKVTGQAARDLIEGQLDQHAGGILDALAQFEPEAAIAAWLGTPRTRPLGSSAHELLSFVDQLHHATTELKVRHEQQIGEIGILD